MTPILLLVFALAADPAPTRFEFVDAFGPPGRAIPTYRSLSLGESPPRPLSGAPAAAVGTYFALAQVGTGPAAALGLVWQPGAPGGSLLWLDADGDGKLTDSERHVFVGKTLEIPARVRISNTSLTRTLVFRRGAGSALYLAVRGHTAGRINLGGKEYSAVLTDGDADGCFDSAGQDRLWIDLNGDGRFDTLTEQFPVGSPVSVGGKSYLIRPNPTGTEIRAQERGSETGRLRPKLSMQPGAVLKSFESQLMSEFGELVILTEVDTPANLPVGSYRVETLTARIADVQGREWSYAFHGQRQSTLTIDAGCESHIDLLEGLNLTTGIDDPKAAAGATVTVSPLWLTPSGVYLTSCEINGGPTGADLTLTDSGGNVLWRAVSGFA
jgi:hypothetical protein